MTLRRPYLLAVLALCGCLHDGLSVPEARVDGGAPIDLRPPGFDLPPHGFDLALPAFDFGAHADLSSATCTQLSSWSGSAPEVLGSPTESPFDFVTWARSFVGSEALSVEIWHRTGTPTVPYTVQLPKTNYLDCEVCVLIDLGFDATRGYGAPAYLALSGTITVTRADDDPSHGQLEVSGSDVHLVEWDFAGDRPAGDGHCYDIGQLALGGSYAGDGGDPPRWK